MKIKVLLVEPKQEPKVIEIENTLQSLQTVVGGLVEYVSLKDDVDLICNEEGKINNLEYNRAIIHDIICGTFIIAGHDNGDTVSLSEENIKYYKDYFELDKDEGLIEFFRRYALNNSSFLLEIDLRRINSETDKKFIRKGVEKEDITEIIKQLDELSNKYDNYHVILATYIYVRFGVSNFQNYIDFEDLFMILEEIKKCSSIFNEELNHKTDLILKHKEDDTDE